MTEQAALLRAIRESPGDDGPRLVYADWLTDHGEGAIADFIRQSLAEPHREAEVSELAESPATNAVGFLVRGDLENARQAVAETLRRIPFDLFPTATLLRVTVRTDKFGIWRVDVYYKADPP